MRSSNNSNIEKDEAAQVKYVDTSKLMPSITTLDPSNLMIYTSATLDPNIKLDSTTSASNLNITTYDHSFNMNNTALDGNSTSSLDPISKLHTTNSLDPTNLEPTYLKKISFHESLKFIDIEVETGNEDQEENFFHINFE